jgi:hypothetical protein
MEKPRLQKLTLASYPVASPVRSCELSSALRVVLVTVVILFVALHVAVLRNAYA